MSYIPYGKQYIDEKDIELVGKALRCQKITTGKFVDKFEQKVSKFLNCKFAISCSSGTSALYLALKSINLNKNDTIIMPNINFISSFNISAHFNPKIFLADVDQLTGQMTPKNVVECCKKFKIKKVKAIITMYNGGYPENVRNFFLLKKKLQCYLIEDACHAFGAEYFYNNKKYKIGSCKHSDISTFSFHPLKTITTGEGGMVTCNSKQIQKQIKTLRSHGIQRSKFHWDYNIIDSSLNFRLTDFQCALGISQLSKINKFIYKRKKIFEYYNKKLNNNNNFNKINYDKLTKPSYHLYFLNLKNNSIKLKTNFIKFMLKNKIITQFHYKSINKFKVFKKYKKGKSITINSNKYFNNCISLPIYFGMNKNEQDYIISKINNFFEKN
tara:strand:+ start:1272 stop:2423 length:1152 start_codon:yes stop_codon:yes gene_type:complete